MTTINNNEFQIVLPCNSSNAYFTDNTPAKYRTRLAMPIQLIGEWEMAIIDIQYTHNWRNILESLKIGFIVSLGPESAALSSSESIDDFDRTIKNDIRERKRDDFCYRASLLPSGYYDSVRDICDYLTEQLRILFPEIFANRNDRTFSFSYNENTK